MSGYVATAAELLRMKQQILAVRRLEPGTTDHFLVLKWRLLDESSRRNLRSMVSRADFDRALGAEVSR